MSHNNPPQARPVRNKKVLALCLAALALLAAGVAIWYVKIADMSGASLLPPCLFREFTGLYCTGCGVTRALHYALNGQFYAAFRMNPLAVVAMPVVLGFLIVVIVRLLRGRPVPEMPLWVPWVALAVIVVFTVARNLPWEPFSWLAPTQLPWVR